VTVITSYGREPGYPQCDEALQGKKVVLSYSDRWKVLVSNETALGEQIFDALPSDFKIGSYLAGSTTRLKSRGLKRDPKARQLYYLDLKYSNDSVEDQNQEDTEQNKPPDQRRPEWSWDFETVGFVPQKDVDDNTISISNVEPALNWNAKNCPALFARRLSPAVDHFAEFKEAHHGMAVTVIVAADASHKSPPSLQTCVAGPRFVNPVSPLSVMQSGGLVPCDFSNVT